MRNDIRNDNEKKDEDIKYDVIQAYTQALKYLVKIVYSKKKSFINESKKAFSNKALTNALLDSINKNLKNLGQALRSALYFEKKDAVNIGSIVYIKYDSSVGKIISGKFFIAHSVDEALGELDLGHGIISILSDSILAREFIGKKKNDEVSSLFNGHLVTGKIINVF